MSQNKGGIKIEYVISGIMLMTMFIGVALGYKSHALLHQPAEECQLKYISQEEIIELEKARIAKEEAGVTVKQELFFGKPEEAVRLAVQIAEKHKGRDTKVIFSLAKIFSQGVESISQQVHAEIIKELKTKEKSYGE